MRFATLDEWLQWQETLHPNKIDLGLERVRRVYRQLSVPAPANKVVTVAGTNGKGSCIALLEALFRDAGFKVGSYTSPHLLRYNERIRINGQAVSDQALFRAFAAIDLARQEQTLTYFEFGTLAALSLFAQSQLDLVLLEVGMGGRLDACNIIDADVSLICSIALDHQAWLGETREAIAIEKAGIMRSARPAICADPDPPRTLLEQADRIGAKLHLQHQDFSLTRGEFGWQWRDHEVAYPELPLPELVTSADVLNRAAVIKVAEILKGDLPFSLGNLHKAMARISLPGRGEMLSKEPEVWVDVAHNPAAAAALAERLRMLPAKKTHLVIGVLADKAIDDILSALAAQVDYYYIAAPATARAMPPEALRDALQAQVSSDQLSDFTSITAAYRSAVAQATPGERIVVTGSFYTVAEIMAVHDGKRL